MDWTWWYLAWCYRGAGWIIKVQLCSAELKLCLYVLVVGKGSSHPAHAVLVSHWLWEGAGGFLPLLSAGAARGGSEQHFLSAWHLPCPPCAVTGVFPAALLFMGFHRVIPRLACSMHSGNGPSLVGSGQSSHFLLSPCASLAISSPTLVRGCGWKLSSVADSSVCMTFLNSPTSPCILFWISLKFLKEGVLTQWWCCWDQCLQKTSVPWDL